MSRRLYLGRLPTDARSEEVSKLFEGYGRIVDVRVMTGFGFVEFESSKDAEDALQNFNGKPFMGANIVVEFAKETRPRREPQEERGGGGARARRPPGIRLIVSGISRDTSWQDLKDFGRDAGNVSFADIDRDYPGQGILEYLSREDADRAVKELDNKDLRGRPVRVNYDDSVCSSPLDLLFLTFSSAMPTTIVAMTAAMIAATIEIDIEMTAAVIAPGLLPAVVTMKNVDPGLLPPRGIMMIEDLQGTMITDAVAMMTADHLIIMMIVVGMKIEDAMTEDAMTRKTVTMIGLQDPPMAKGGVDGFLFAKGRSSVREERWTAFSQLLSLRILDFTKSLVLSSFTRTVYFSNGWPSLLGSQLVLYGFSSLLRTPRLK
ncbi:hypothetical protein CPB83DRAFT_816357 [Crepidotus variabilis]|uniref:RRM domain-containing protein n=1 Tax=Crepidotus variabilis TaxID=179855 RepID=A0A9P6EDF7_9AGAR|nr:hypothetical protein CPB83DRAFT_816357 [Crepidotus variabilis]